MQASSQDQHLSQPRNGEIRSQTAAGEVKPRIAADGDVNVFMAKL
jgi:hypothetical protein